MTPTLVRGDFAQFFTTLHPGATPFRWQERLLDHLFDHGRWPELIDAPTGAGKTAVIDVHVFALALTADDLRLPRRLAMVVPRRSLVDNQLEHATAVADSLTNASDGVLRTVADRLRSVGTTTLDSPLRVARLRGGELPSRRWRDDPLVATVLCCTPDMWGSRVLMRGYGTSRWMRPVESALLTHDAVVVVDEAHLARQLVMTARRVAELQQRPRSATGVLALQVVETTATPSLEHGRTRVGVDEADLADDQKLKDRVLAVKFVEIRPLPSDPNQVARRRAAVSAHADAATELRRRYGSTVGCFVNRVDDATALHAELVARKLNAKLICGRMRPHDVTKLSDSGLLDSRGDPTVDVIVSTQSLEVGIDVDLSAAVTALAPGPSMAQRFGRVNRRGRRDEAAIMVVVPADLELEPAPYDVEDLVTGLEWVSDLAEDPGGASPWNIRERRPGDLTPRRTLYQRLEQADAWLLARTAQSLTAEPGLDLWLADDLDVDSSMGVIVRAGLTGDNAYDEKILRASDPRRHEIVPTTIRVAKEIAARAPADDWWVQRAGEWEVLTWSGGLDDAGDRTPQLRPADVLVLSPSVAAFSAGVLDPKGKDTLDDVAEAGDAPVLLRLGPGFPAARNIGEVPVRGFTDLFADTEPPPAEAVAAGLSSLTDTTTDEDLRANLASAIGSSTTTKIRRTTRSRWPRPRTTRARSSAPSCSPTPGRRSPTQRVGKYSTHAKRSRWTSTRRPWPSVPPG